MQNDTCIVPGRCVCYYSAAEPHSITVYNTHCYTLLDKSKLVDSQPILAPEILLSNNAAPGAALMLFAYCGEYCKGGVAHTKTYHQVTAT